MSETIGECVVQLVDGKPNILQADDHILIGDDLLQPGGHIVIGFAAGTRVDLAGQVAYELTGQRSGDGRGWHARLVKAAA